MNSNTPPLRQITLTLLCVSVLLGFLVALGVLSGDAQGRVNLLYLLVLFAFLPVAGLLLSLLFLALNRRHSRRGFSGLVLDLPLWPRHWKRALLTLGPGEVQKPWFFYQTQILALGFGLGGLLAFFILLVGSDISFVWRSTLLEAGDLYPVLHALAAPWAFWQEAQPSLELLRQSQDFRAARPDFEPGSLGHWWKYVLAAQCAYNLLPRLAMLLGARNYYLKNARAAAAEPTGHEVRKALNAVPREGRLAPVVPAVEGEFDLIDWAGAATLLAALERQTGAPQRRLNAGPLASPEEEAECLPAVRPWVVLVKSWEPPMGELEDFLRKGRGWVLPLDWDDSGIRPTKAIHLQEWRRFSGALDDWRVLQVEASR